MEQIPSAAPAISPGLYRHYKGRLYQVLHLAAHTEVNDQRPWRSGVLLGAPADSVADPWLRLMQQARQQLQRQGLEHADTRGLQALAAAAQAQWGDESQPLQQWLLQMEQ